MASTGISFLIVGGLAACGLNAPPTSLSAEPGVSDRAGSNSPSVRPDRVQPGEMFTVSYPASVGMVGGEWVVRERGPFGGWLPTYVLTPEWSVGTNHTDATWVQVRDGILFTHPAGAIPTPGVDPIVRRMQLPPGVKRGAIKVCDSGNSVCVRFAAVP